MKRSSRKGSNKYIDDLFSTPLYEDILSLNAEIQGRIKTSSEANVSSQERFEEVRELIFDIVQKAGNLSHLTSSTASNIYDFAVEVAARWSAYAAYSGSRISLNHISGDERAGGLSAIKDAYRPKIKGKVVGLSSDKTVKVEVVRKEKERRTGKYVSKRKCYLVHDEYNKCKLGDNVVALGSRPVSKRKHHIIAAVLGKT